MPLYLLLTGWSVTASAAAAAACADDPQPLVTTASLHLESRDQARSYPLQVEVARTAEEKRFGLMCRRALSESRGMLFVYRDERPRRIWMKNTLIPLDILFLSSSGQILHLVEDAPPCKTANCPIYESRYPARYVLELPGGLMRRLQLGGEARVRFD